jgi:imidazolonepropionase-like amidohydrolase
VEPARFPRREAEFGRIAPGLRADLVLLQDNPLEDIRALREPVGVVLRGHWLSRAALERSLAEL